jgi:hypothetical protein
MGFWDFVATDTELLPFLLVATELISLLISTTKKHLLMLTRLLIPLLAIR